MLIIIFKLEKEIVQTYCTESKC